MAKCDLKDIKMPPAWITTFADLMSLLLAFFVLLFSFSELDKAKYKQVAGSMRDAFGVQQRIRVKDPPKGINIIAREFSPGVPKPTTLNEVRQFTTSDSLPFPVIDKNKEREKEKGDAEEPSEQQLADRDKLEVALRDEIEADVVEMEMVDHRIIVRIKEKGAFPSGSDRLEPAFEPIVERLGHTLVETTGAIAIAGHTDSRPIRTSRFRSNWELSAARALTVAHAFFDASDTLKDRVHLEAHGSQHPVDTNETAEGRARNRRVEISLVYEEGLYRGEAGPLPRPRPAPQPTARQDDA